MYLYDYAHTCVDLQEGAVGRWQAAFCVGTSQREVHSVDISVAVGVVGEEDHARQRLGV